MYDRRVAKAKAKPAKAKPAKKQPAKQQPAKAPRRAAKSAAAKPKLKVPATEQQQIDAAVRELRAFGLRYPGAHLKSPWPGHEDLAVDDKTFAYLTPEGEPFRISCKLPQSNAVALVLPHCEPAAYGLGKSGWVSATFPGGNLPVDMLKEWIDESYRAQASKKRIAQIG